MKAMNDFVYLIDVKKIYALTGVESIFAIFLFCGYTSLMFLRIGFQWDHGTTKSDTFILSD